MIAGLLAAWAFIRSPAGHLVGVGVIVIAALTFGFVKGEAIERAKSQDTQLRAALAVAEADLRISHDAEQRANDLASVANARAATLDERLADYETSTSGAPAVCALDDAAAKRLRDLVR